VWLEARAKFQPMRCQESARGILLMNEARAQRLGPLPCVAARPGPKGLAAGKGPVLCCRWETRRSSAEVPGGWPVPDVKDPTPGLRRLRNSVPHTHQGKDQARRKSPR
jgi:hypothetical protein